jgi:hypothetical protein
LLTFTSKNPGPLVRYVAASGEAISLRQHHSLVKLSDEGYTPREVDSRIGVFGPTLKDYATPIRSSLSRISADGNTVRRESRHPRSHPKHHRECLSGKQEKLSMKGGNLQFFSSLKYRVDP